MQTSNLCFCRLEMAGNGAATESTPNKTLLIAGAAAVVHFSILELFCGLPSSLSLRQLRVVFVRSMGWIEAVFVAIKTRFYHLPVEVLSFT